jgi:hypothetical protein
MARTLLFALLASVAFVSPALAQEGSSDDKKREIVVTARSLKDTEADLKACLARKCPPDQDVKATLAHAENQFVEGDYKNARATLLKSIGRNRKHKDQYAIPVSNLLRANGNIAISLGEANAYKTSVLDMRDVIKDALPANDYRVLGAELEVADSRLKLGFPQEAKDKYLAIEKQALEQKLPNVAAIAKLRELSLLVLIAKDEKDAQSINQAAKALDEYIAKPTVGAEKFGIVAEVLRSRLDRDGGSAATTEALIRRYAALGVGGRPLLIQANPVEQNSAAIDRANNGGSDLNRIAVNNVDKRWVDVGFWISADGKVEEPEILRNSGTTEWVKPVLKSISSRIYTPSAAADGSTPGFYAVERYTLTANWENDGTGSRIRKRAANSRIELIDLSTDQ